MEDNGEGIANLWISATLPSHVKVILLKKDVRQKIYLPYLFLRLVMFRI